MDKMNGLYARLLSHDASFLTCREKEVFLRFLLSISEERFLSLSLDDIAFRVGRNFRRVRWSPAMSMRRALLAARIMEARRIGSVCVLDAAFPPMLREMDDPPFMLFYRGDLKILGRKCVSVVGTRRASPKAAKAASDFSKEACDDGMCVVSGLAFGIDAAAHKGALLSSTPATCAVLPGGIDEVAPRSHIRLAARILESGGLVLSEYLPGTPAARFRYVQRNRIVAALSPATLVVQAHGGSGAMITAALSLDYNRELFFHAECFSRESLAAGEFSESQWKKLVAQGKKIEYKMNNTPRALVDDGACVVHDYGEFRKMIAPLPFLPESARDNLFEGLEK